MIYNVMHTAQVCGFVQHSLYLVSYTRAIDMRTQYQRHDRQIPKTLNLVPIIPLPLNSTHPMGHHVAS